MYSKFITVALAFACAFAPTGALNVRRDSDAVCFRFPWLHCVTTSYKPSQPLMARAPPPSTPTPVSCNGYQPWQANLAVCVTCIVIFLRSHLRHSTRVAPLLFLTASCGPLNSGVTTTAPSLPPPSGLNSGAASNQLLIKPFAQTFPHGVRALGIVRVSRSSTITVSGLPYIMLRATPLVILPELGRVWAIARQPLNSFLFVLLDSYQRNFSMQVNQLVCILLNRCISIPSSLCVYSLLQI